MTLHLIHHHRHLRQTVLEEILVQKSRVARVEMVLLTAEMEEEVAEEQVAAVLHRRLHITSRLA